MADEKPTIDRRFVRTMISQDVGRSLGPVWSRLKGLATDAGLDDMEKRAAAFEYIGDIRKAANAYCDMLTSRIVDQAPGKTFEDGGH